jgi:hypothetical protein
LAQTAAFQKLQQPLFDLWAATEGVSIQEIIAQEHSIDPPSVLAQHYFVTNPLTGMGVSPTWDFRSSGNKKFDGVEDAFIIAKGLANIPAPNAAVDVAWLQVENIGGAQGGKIAEQVFRTDTVNGQPPATVRVPSLCIGCSITLLTLPLVRVRQVSGHLCQVRVEVL